MTTINKNLLPQAVLDAVEGMVQHPNIHIRTAYKERVETIKIFCEMALAEQARKKK